MSKAEIRMTGAVRMLTGAGGLTAAVCLGLLGWWVAGVIAVYGTWRLITGLGLVVTGRPIIDLD
jgi:hypothetical protein